MDNDRMLAYGAMAVAIVALAFGLPQSPLAVTDNGSRKGMTRIDDNADAPLDLKVQDTLADSQTFVAATYEIYNNGVQVASGTTSSNSFTTETLTEGKSYTVRVYDDDGSGDDYYHASYKIESMPETTKTLVMGNTDNSVAVNEESGVTTSVTESSGSTDDDGTLKMTSGDSETFTLELETSSQDSLFNSPKVFFKSNDTAAIDNIKVVGESNYVIPDRLEGTYTEGYTTGISQVASTDESPKTVKVEVVSDDNTDPSNVKITALVADETKTTNSAGNWISAVEDSSDSDIGAADTTQTVTVN